MRPLIEMLIGAGSSFGRSPVVVPAMPVGMVVRPTSDLASIAFIQVGRIPPLCRCVLALPTHGYLRSYRYLT